eukprot:TRINITY_DN3333_c0_g1_i1.p1 TRINITY_DN3333_c0_g1~~TRINITY_DN3333_c0_g1_i1.p1  ORF type:complete len:317 (+),score=54.36 TRINITY_DN3333_c0_g1_i1:101-1051(+)
MTVLKLLLIVILLGAFVTVSNALNRIPINEHENQMERSVHEEEDYEGDEAADCDVTINGTFYPCWYTLTPAEVPQDGCYFCPAGYYSDDTTTACVEKCPSGWCVQGHNCSSCPPGTYTNSVSSYTCYTCPYGHISTVNASTSCTPCDPGFEANTERTRCDICRAGYYSVDGIVCSACERGLFSSAPGASYCKECGQGFYNQLEGETVCSVCPQGQYCPSTTTSTPQICPVNQYCPSGTVQPIPCPSLYRSPGGSAACNAGVAFYSVIICSVLGFCGIILAMWKYKNHLQGKEQTERRLEIDRLIPPSRDGPVYRGL